MWFVPYFKQGSISSTVENKKMNDKLAILSGTHNNSIKDLGQIYSKTPVSSSYILTPTAT